MKMLSSGRLLLLFAALGILVLALNGCSSGTTPSTPAVQVAIAGVSTIRLGATAQFTATVTNTSNIAVVWQVNAVTGGSATTGTISATGLYTAPTVMPAVTSVTITAVSVAQASATGSAPLSLYNPAPALISATAVQVGTTLNYTVTVTGSGFVPGAVINSSGVAQTTTYVSATQLTAVVAVTYTTTSLAISVTNPNPGSATSGVVIVTLTVTTDATTAARLLDQATFGPTSPSIQHVQSIGVDAWINEQFATPSSTIPVFNPNGNARPQYCLPPEDTNSCVNSPWWQNVITGPDQLRQRVTFALTQMFVVSQLGKTSNPQGIVLYQNQINADAFTNFATIMNDVATSVSMGEYLNMLNSAAPPAGEIANENFGRENMQLFTLGLNLLNQDGTPQLDSSGNLIPTYTQAQVQAFARAFTGWTYASSTGGPSATFPGTPNYAYPMVPVDSQHDTTSKTLLNGTVLPAGQTSMQDFLQAQANIFAHPNVGPFVGKQLIQHLVTSTPSPAYVARVSAVFANNGSGVRGDMKAVLRAILEDPEARAGDTNAAFDGGHLREPVLQLTAGLRGLDATNNNVNGAWFSLEGTAGNLNESPYQSGSVFNFFPPSYIVPLTTLNAPEFGIENTATVIARLTLTNTMVFNNINNMTTSDLQATGILGMLATNPPALVDYLSMLFMHSQMPTNMRTAILNELATLPSGPAQVARVATYLVLSSSQYKIIH